MEVRKFRYDERLAKARRRTTRIVSLIIAGALFLGTSGYSYAALAKEIPTQQASLTTLQATTPEVPAFSWPAQGQSAIGSLDSGFLMSSTSSEQARPIASMTKVIAALAIMKRQPFGENEAGQIYTMTANDVAIYNAYVAKFGSVMKVQAGQELTQYQALQAMLLPSANNIADSVVGRVFGSMGAYIQYANELVQEYGMSHTVVDDASGFSPLTVSTPTDMVLLARQLLAQPVLAGIVSQKSAVIPGSGVITNTNKLLIDSDVIGIKTGTTDEAGSCLLFAGRHMVSESLSVTVVGVVMGQPNWTAVQRNVRSLLDTAYQGFGEIEIVKAGQSVGAYTTPWGARTDIVAESDLSYIGWKGTSLQPEVSTQHIEAPLAAGTEVGKLRVVGLPEVAVKLVANQSVTPPSIWWRLSNYW